MSKRPLDPQDDVSKVPRILDAPYAIVHYMPSSTPHVPSSTPHVPSSTPSTLFDLLGETLEPVSLKRNREGTETQATKRRHSQ